MKNIGSIIGIAIVAILCVLCATGCSKYNSMIKLRNDVKTSWSNVEAQYQRRANLIPNLVETVKGYAAHESNTLQAVTEARTKVGSITLNADSLTEEGIKKYVDAQNQLAGAMKSLIAVSEAYPDLKANENFLDFQYEYAGTENRITEALRKYNDTAREYNTSIALFPTNLFAGFFGFKEEPYFSAAEGAEKAPEVKF